LTAYATCEILYYESNMKTYTLEELNATHKTGLDYVKEHENMLKALKNQPVPENEKEPPHLDTAGFWTTGNLIDAEGNRQEGSGRVPKAAADE